MEVVGAGFGSARDRSILRCDIHLVVAVIPKKLSSGGEVLPKGRRFTDH